jgi:regulatory protein
MPLITDIRTLGASRSQTRPSRPQGGGEWRLVVLDDGRRLRVDAEQVARHGLEPGEPVGPRLVAGLAARDAYLRARERALRLLAVRSRSIEELRQRLVRGRAPRSAVRAVIADLVGQGYLDDLAFARAWISHRIAAGPVAALRIRWELRQKRVPPVVIDQAVREGLGAGSDLARAEEQSAIALATRRLSGYRHLSPDRQMRRLAALLGRRGFGPATIVRALRVLGKGEVLEEPDG